MLASLAPLQKTISRMTLPNGDHYVGQFVNGVRHGKGVYHFASGQTKELEFENGVEKSN